MCIAQVGSSHNDPVYEHRYSHQTSYGIHVHDNSACPYRNETPVRYYWIFLGLGFHCQFHKYWWRDVSHWHKALVPVAYAPDAKRLMTIYNSAQITNWLHLNKKKYGHCNLFATNQYQFVADQNVLPLQNVHLSTAYVLKQIGSIYP